MCIASFPVRVSSDHGDYFIMASCGKCIECVTARQNSWKLRLCSEADNYSHVYFFTLTYSDSSVPITFSTLTGEELTTARKSDVQSWIKLHRERYLRKYGERIDMKYFICAEYGPEGSYVDSHGIVRQSTCRPHYHGIILSNCDSFIFKPWFNDWASRFGYVDFQEVGITREDKSSVANYVSKYVCKGEFSSRVDDIERGFIEPAWLICSKNIGLSYVEKHRFFHDPHGLRESFSCDYNEDLVRLILSQTPSLEDKIRDILRLSKVYDGDNFAYRMPRYYRDRLYGVVKETKRFVKTARKIGPVLASREALSQSDNQPQFHFAHAFCPREIFFNEVKEVKIRRYCHENFLSIALRVIIQSDIDVEYARNLKILQKSYPHLSDVECVRILDSRQLVAKENRAASKRSSLANFYESNFHKNKSLNYGS